MDAYHHFGLTSPPFDSWPDPAFFHDAPSHAEALAMLRFAVIAGKGCAVVVGPAGSGKTLLARMATESGSPGSPIWWVPGRGQPDNATRVRVYPPGTRMGPEQAARVARDSTLGAELRAKASQPDPPLLVVDAADELPARGWREVIALLADEVRFRRPMTVLLLGLPSLLELLAKCELEQIQRRIFRICCLEALSVQQTRQYIHARIAAAGGRVERVFDEEAIAAIWRLAQGNPAQINRLCDNALLEAYGDEHERVSAADVANALYAIRGGLAAEGLSMNAPIAAPLTRPALPGVQSLALVDPRPAPPGAPRAAAALADLICASRRRRVSSPVLSAPTREPAARTAEAPTAARLKELEVRLLQALRAVRQARDRQTTAQPTVRQSKPDPVDARATLLC